MTTVEGLNVLFRTDKIKLEQLKYGDYRLWIQFRTEERVVSRFVILTSDEARQLSDALYDAVEEN